MIDYAAAMDRIFSDYSKPGSPGAAVAVIKDGAVAFSRGYGLANLEYDKAISPETVFHVASVSKQFTCFAICLLKHRGLLDYDDDVRRHLPYVPDFGQTISIRHLMHHVSGLRDQWELLRLAGWRMDDVITQEHVRKIVSRQRHLNFAPGSEFLYSNTGYTLLAEIVVRVSGMSLREFCQTEIFAPLSMTKTHFHDNHEELVPGRAYSYAPTDNGFRHSVLSYANTGATSLFTTVKDLAKWVINFEDRTVGAEGALDDLFSQFTLESGEDIPYMFGLTRGNHRGLCHVGHTGSDAGYRTACICFPSEGFAVIIFCNVSTALPSTLAMEVADLWLEGSFPEAAPAAPCGQGFSCEEALEPYVGTFLISRLGLTVAIAEQWGQLFITIGEQPRMLLLPCGRGKFWLAPLRTTVSAVRDDDGTVVALDIVLYSQAVRANRLNPLPLSDAQLRAFAGTYHSDELATGYELEVCEGGLRMKHSRLEDVMLIPTDLDIFEGLRRVGILKFARDSGGITGFTLTGSRVRNLEFRRT